MQSHDCMYTHVHNMHGFMRVSMRMHIQTCRYVVALLAIDMYVDGCVDTHFLSYTCF